jgi:hypothetical protein
MGELLYLIDTVTRFLSTTGHPNSEIERLVHAKFP